MDSDASPTTRALLLTDVVDSTRLTEQLGDAAMSRCWALHDRLARDLIAVWRGREIDKSDGMLVLFGDVADAAGFALAYQRALRLRPEIPIVARVGIHAGVVTLRSNDPSDIAQGAKPLEVSGIALPLTARVMSVALGGQIILSAAAAGALPPGCGRLRSHGHWQFQGVSEPAELVELADEHTSFRPPSDSAKAQRVVRQGQHWVPVAQLRHSLPSERDSFVGRGDELEQVTDKLDRGARLVSILGMGGCGKTRLSVHAAWRLLAHYPGGAWFCDLSAARSLEGVHFAVAQGLELALGSGDPVQQIAQAIAGRGRCLIVLDNFEQVGPLAEATLGAWLDRTPLAQFLVTTREVLGIAGEEILALSPLGPNDGAELFRQRVAAVRSGHSPNADDLAAMRQLAIRLDGLPLAIELVAARARTMSPRSLATRMRDRFDAMYSRQARHDRQATLRAALNWSWDLLGDHEKQALAILSVFEGGFSPDTATAVLAATAPGGPSMHELLPSLVDKCLVRPVNDERFDLLETVREYAAGHLQTEGSFPGSGPGMAQMARHGHWVCFSRYGELLAVADRCAEANNLVAACRAATAAGDFPSAMGCLVAAWAALRLTGPYRVAVQLAQALLGHDALDDRMRGLAHWVAADALDLLGEQAPAHAHAESGLEAALRAGDSGCTARLLLVRGRRRTQDGELEAAMADLKESHHIALALGDQRLQMLALNELGLHLDYQARWEDARDCYARALAIARRIGDQRLEGGLLGNLGGLLHDRGELDAARAHFEQALELARLVGDRRWAGNACCNLGLVLQQQGDGSRAGARFEEALLAAREIGHVRLEYTALCNLGILWSAEGRQDEATTCLQQAVDVASAAGDRRAEGQFRSYLALNLARRGEIGAARHQLAEGERLLLAAADRLSHALLLCNRAEVEALDRNDSAARAAFNSARVIAGELACGVDSELGRRLQVLEALLAESFADWA
jgi:predicted ATPase/class 3 adenylate cyclase/Tfp pilus assembly protein PilF